MKTLYLVRHAKSSWDDPSLPDFDRPLNDRGKKDAPAMAERIKDKGSEIDHFISSPAKRARKTAKIFAEAFDFSKKDIEQIEELYHAEPGTFNKVINSIPDKYNHVALFSHNPGITDFVNQLTSVRIDNVPTCGVFAVKIPIEKWTDFQQASKEFMFFDFPKNGEEKEL